MGDQPQLKTEMQMERKTGNKYYAKHCREKGENSQGRRG